MLKLGTCAVAVALIALSLATRVDAQTPPANQALQDCMNLPDPDRNIIDCTTVIERGDAESKRNLAIAYLNRAIAYLQKNDFPRALADLDASIAADPSMPGAFYNRALYYHQKGDLERAKADYDTVIRLDPKMINAYGNRATIHYLQGASDLALHDYETALGLAPNNPELIHNIGLVHQAKGDLDGAITRFTQAIELVPPARRARLLFSRARAHAAKGDFERAASDFGAAAELEKTRPEIQACFAAVQRAADARRRREQIAPLPEQCVRDMRLRV